MNAIQSRPSFYRLNNRLNASSGKPISPPQQPSVLAALKTLPQQESRTSNPVRPWHLLSFSGALSRRIAEDSAILSDAFQMQYADPPLEQHEKTNAVKLKLAEDLTAWMVSMLNQKEAVAAVIARNGSAQAQRHDPTGMAHSGLALKEPNKVDWIIYNLVHDVPHDSKESRFLDWLSGIRPKNKPLPNPLRTSPSSPFTTTAEMDSSPATTPRSTTSAQSSLAASSQSKENPFRRSLYGNSMFTHPNTAKTSSKKTPQSQIWRSEPLEFFYSQPVEKKDALLLIPPKDLQIRLRDGILSGHYKKLYFTPNYNLVSHPHSNTSLNCNKWVLMNIMAAKQADYSHTNILKAIEQFFKPGRIRMHPVLRPIAKIHPTIMPQEVPAIGPIHTVTVESLYRSDLFEEKEFHIPRSLK